MNRIFKNSYIILAISFIVLSILCYMLRIGYTTSVDSSGKVTKKFSWKYPLAISLVIWIIWHFWLYPPKDELITKEPPRPFQINYSPTDNQGIRSFVNPNEIGVQKISLINWN